ncbi:hypothetical protein GCM10027614_06670 [Micromonospora vulcania]
MAQNERSNEVRQLRVVVEAADYDDAVALYQDALGLKRQAAFEGEGGARVVILDAGRATLEIANPAQRAMIDDVEVGRQVSPRIRLAFEVDDATTTTDALVAAGADLVAAPTQTPWNSLNSRLDTAGGLQITLFQELGARQPASVPFALVDVFGDAPLTGNPLGVVDLTDWDGPVPEAWYSTVARELNQSETTFILPGRDGAVRELRSYTAGGVEVFGAGHNSLGAWYWLLATGRLGSLASGTEIVQRIGERPASRRPRRRPHRHGPDGRQLRRVRRSGTRRRRPRPRRGRHLRRAGAAGGEHRSRPPDGRAAKPRGARGGDAGQVRAGRRGTDGAGAGRLPRLAK